LCKDDFEIKTLERGNLSKDDFEMKPWKGVTFSKGVFENGDNGNMMKVT
jgi:hypothetical protein